MIKFVQKGNFNNTDRFFNKAKKLKYQHILEKYGEKGVQVLASATPIDSGLTAESWSYEIVVSNGLYSIYWKNSNINDGVPIAIILQYGHGTGTGGYVQGREYINPAIKPIFDELAKSVWQEVSNL